MQRSPAPIFRDPRLQEEFEHAGFVQLQLLDAARVEHLRDFYARTTPPGLAERGFTFSWDHGDSDYLVRLRDEMVAVVKPAIDEHLVDMDLFVGGFIPKRSREDSEIIAHQHSTYVDETRFRSAVVWMPLCDVGPDNGGLGVVPGSHRLFPHQVRFSPWPYCPGVADHADKLPRYYDVRSMRPGEALVIDNAVAHGSPRNRSHAERLAAAAWVAPRAAQLVHHNLHKGPGGLVVDTYEVEPAFFMRYPGNETVTKLFETGEHPAHATLVGSRPFVRERIEWDDLQAAIESSSSAVLVPAD
jgi:hypothetical protein